MYSTIKHIRDFRDLCKMDEDGCIYILGRKNAGEQFKVRSFIVYAKVIEDVMSEMEGVKNIVAVSRPLGSTFGEEISYCIE